MALLDLGDISFGLGAETAKLKAAVSELRKFGTVVNKTARSQQSGAQKAASQLNKQERAIRAALQSLLAMNAEIRRTKANPALIGQNTRAFQRLTKTLTSGEVGIVTFTRAQDRFRASLNNTGRTLKSFKATEARKSLGRFNEVMRDLESASVLAVGPLSGLGARIRALGAITSRSTLKIAGLAAGITGVIVGLVKLTAGAIRSRREIEKIEKSLIVATGSLFGARKEFEFISETAVKFGIDIKAAGEQFAKLSAAARGTILEGKPVKTLFEGTAAAASALGLSIEEVSGIFRALQQIVSKGRVQAEELRGQFGERLVGGFKLAADAMGVTTQALGEMVEQGKVGVELLVKLGDTLRERFAKAGQDAAKGFQGSINNLNNAILLFNKELDGALGASQIFIGLIQSITSIINTLKPEIDALVAGFFSLGIAMLGAVAPEIFKGFIGLIGLFISLKNAVLGFNLAVLANPLVAFSSILGRVILALGTGVAAFFAFKNAGDELAESNKFIIKTGKAFIAVAKEMAGASAEVTKELIDDTRKQVEATRARIASLAADAAAIRKNALVGTGLIGEVAIADIEDKQILALKDSLTELIVQLKELADIGKRPATGLDALSGTAQDLQDDLDDLILDFRALRREEDALASGGGLQALQAARDLNEALDALGDTTDLTRQDIRLLTEGLVEAGIGSAELLKGFSKLTDDEALQVLIGQILELVRANRQIEETNNAVASSLEDYNDVMLDAISTINDMQQELSALQSGAPDAIKDLKREFADRDDLEKFIEGLEEIGASNQQIAALAETFRVLREDIRAAENELEDLEPATKAIEGAFGTLKDTIIDTFTGSKTALEALRDLALDVIRRVLDAIIEITLIRPAIENTVNAFNDLDFGGGKSKGGGGGGFFGKIFGSILGGLGGGSTGSGISPTPGATFGTPFAAGGRPPVGKLALVGEKGPELFIPDRAGTIIPNDEIGGGGGKFVFNQIINMSPGVAEAVKRAIDQARPQLEQDAMNAILNARRLGVRI